ncbi:hypothetical protein DXG01_012959, partial [Tephrocybe rancida]
ALSTLSATLSLSSLPSSSTSNENDNNDILTLLVVELVVVDDDKLNKLINDVVRSRKGSINGALKYDRIVATVATIVGLIGRVPGPAATAAAI